MDMNKIAQGIWKDFGWSFRFGTWKLLKTISRAFDMQTIVSNKMCLMADSVECTKSQMLSFWINGGDQPLLIINRKPLEKVLT